MSFILADSYRPVGLTLSVARIIVKCAHPENDEANIPTYDFHKRNEMYKRFDESSSFQLLL